MRLYLYHNFGENPVSCKPGNAIIQTEQRHILQDVVFRVFTFILTQLSNAAILVLSVTTYLADYIK